MTRPVRLQLSRRASASLQALSIATNGLTAVNVARPGKWGNPWSVDKAREIGFQGTDRELVEMCVGFFRNSLERGLPTTAKIRDDIGALRGKNLACWCAPGAPCHADVLLELANKDRP